MMITMMGAGGRGTEALVLLVLWRRSPLSCASFNGLNNKKMLVFFVLCSILIKSSRSRMKNIFHSLRLIGFLLYL